MPRSAEVPTRPSPPSACEGLLAAKRFFVQLSRLWVACPGCRYLHELVDPEGKTPRRRSRVWDPRSNRFTCSECGETFILGLVAWKIPEGTTAEEFALAQMSSEEREALMPGDPECAVKELLGGGYLVEVPPPPPPLPSPPLSPSPPSALPSPPRPPRPGRGKS